MYRSVTEQMLSFIEASPTAFHAVQNISERLDEAGFLPLLESRNWELERGGCYYVTRNSSSILAFRIGTELEDYSFMITASHSDSPSFRLKEKAEMDVRDKYTRLNTEGYGGMICSSWMDRPLSVAGRVLLETETGVETRLVNVDRDLLLIPNLAIHMDRKMNDGHAYNKQIDMLPLFCGEAGETDGMKLIVAETLHEDLEKILDMDLYVYSRSKPSIWGAYQEFVSSPRLDDLQCAYASLEGFLRGKNENTISVFACFDNEEVGSGTKQGAASTFLSDTLSRVNAALGKSREEYYRAAASGFMLSCDNAHAVHPNFTGKTDDTNCVYMNEGIVIKSSANQKYTSDGLGIAIFRKLCRQAGVPVQFFSNRSDMAGGSTLGNIAMTQVSMNAIDVGLPQLAMHSAYETAGVKDTLYLLRAVETFFNSRLQETETGRYDVRIS
ncbi:MAG: M18 family aminopeptidase [Lachnospiraceae bacterium]|nr:M18 family aminopeptidase [Lachnospiraceae bacterium]